MQSAHDALTLSTPVLLLASLTGCSFFMPAPQANYQPTEAPTCATSRSSPGGDLFIAGASLFFLTTAAACDGNRTGIDDDPWLDECEGDKAIMLTTGVLATVAIISAVRGFQKASTCRKHWRLHRQCLVSNGQNCAMPVAKPVSPPPRDPGEQLSPACQAHRQAIRTAKDQKTRLQLIQKTPSECMR